MFKESGHENGTTMTYENKSFVSPKVMVGSYELTDELKNKMTATTGVTLEISGNLPEGYSVDGNYITNVKSEPAVGDVRIRYTYHDAREITVVATKNGNTFKPYVTKSSLVEDDVYDGVMSKSEIVELIRNEDFHKRWSFRLYGLLGAIFSIMLILGPATTVLSFIPFLGRIANAGIFLGAVLLGLILSLLAVAITWVIVRPIVGVALLVGMIILVIILARHSKKHQKHTA